MNDRYSRAEHVHEHLTAVYNGLVLTKAIRDRLRRTEVPLEMGKKWTSLSAPDRSLSASGRYALARAVVAIVFVRGGQIPRFDLRDVASGHETPSRLS